LEERLDKVVKAEGKDGVFVKLSSRSPKDAVITSEKTVKIFRQLLEEYKEKNGSIDDNAKLICINKAHILALQMFDAKEILSIFLSSDRVYEDLRLAMDYKDQWSQKFVIRQWIPIPVEYEYRGFVFEGKFNCLSQYYHYTYFPHLVKEKDVIEKKIKTFWNQMKDQVPLQPKTYVIDFAVDLKNDRVYLIELNPFGDYEGMGTSCAMYDKVKEQDRAILFNKDKDIWDFRIETGPAENIYKLMGNEWRNLMLKPHQTFLNKHITF